MKKLAVILVFMVANLAAGRENPFAPGDINESIISSNIIESAPPFEPIITKFPSDARELRQIVFFYKSVDGQIKQKIIEANASFDWHDEFELKIAEKVSEKTGEKTGASFGSNSGSGDLASGFKNSAGGENFGADFGASENGGMSASGGENPAGGENTAQNLSAQMSLNKNSGADFNAARNLANSSNLSPNSNPNLRNYSNLSENLNQNLNTQNNANFLNHGSNANSNLIPNLTQNQAKIAANLNKTPPKIELPLTSVNLAEFIKFDIFNGKINVFTSDRLLRDFVIDHPNKIVIDFARNGVNENRVIAVGQGGVRKIELGSHSGFYRVIIWTDGNYHYNIRTNGGHGYSIVLK